jgi:hypothetical protein
MNDSQKLLKAMLGDRGYETLEKAIYKQRTQAVVDPLEYYLPLIVVPRTILSWLIQTIKPMKPGEIKDVKFPGRDDIAIHFEKQDIDQYRAEFVSGGRVIHSFEKQSLPAASAHLMTVGELYDEFGEANKPEVAKVYDHEKALEISEEKHSEEGKKPEFSALHQMIELANVKPASDPEQIKWEMSHANVRELTAVIGKLVDSLTARHMFGRKLEDELDKVSEKEVEGDPQKRENAQTPEEKNKADIKAIAANPAIKEKQQSILEVRDHKAEPTQKLAQEGPEPKKVKEGEDAAEGKMAKQAMSTATDGNKAANQQASRNIASPRMAATQKEQQTGIEQRMSSDGIKKEEMEKAKLESGPSDREKRKIRQERADAAVKPSGTNEHLHPKARGDSRQSPLAFWGRQRDLLQYKKMPKPNLPKSELLSKPYASDAQRRWAHTDAGTKALGGKEAVHHWDQESKGRDLPEHVKKEEMGKAEMPKGAGQPKAPHAPQPPKPPVPAGNNPQASAAKQAQMSGTGGYKPPQTPGAMKPKNPTMKPNMTKSDYFRSKLGKTEIATEEMLFKSTCPECGKPEFVKGEDGNPEFTPCACFRVLKKDEEGHPAKFVHAIRKSDGTYGLEFDKDADPEAVKMFLLTLKARLLIKKNHGI